MSKCRFSASAAGYGVEATEKLGVEAGDNTLAVAVLPVDQQLNLKCMAKAIGAKKFSHYLVGKGHIGWI